MNDERLERIEKRLDEIAEMLKELVEMARRDWEIYQAALKSPSGFEQTAQAKNRFRESMRQAAQGSAAYVQGDNAYTEFLKERFGKPDYKPLSVASEAPDLSDVWSACDKDPYEGMYDEGGEDVNERFYETEETEKAEVKKGEIKAEEVPQKGKTTRGKRRKRSGAPDYD